MRVSAKVDYALRACAELAAAPPGPGYLLARPTAEISVADVIRAFEGPIASVRGVRPDEVEYAGAATVLRDTWLELRTAMRGVLEETSLADLVERAGRSGRRKAQAS